MQKEFEEGRVLVNPPWFERMKEFKKLENRNFIASVPTQKEYMQVLQDHDRMAREDIDGPDVSNETIRSRK